MCSAACARSHRSRSPNPAATIGTSTYGKILSAAGADGNRDFQFTVRLTF
jgi:hypothetical protein